MALELFKPFVLGRLQNLELASTIKAAKEDDRKRNASCMGCVRRSYS